MPWEHSEIPIKLRANRTITSKAKSSWDAMKVGKIP
jgi:hypothetical protein